MQLVPELASPKVGNPGAPAWLPKKDPWLPPDLTDDVIWAIRAFSKGNAGEGQQRMVWNYLMYLTGTGDQYNDLSFRPGVEGMRATDFAEGKRFVGLQLRKPLHPALTPKGKTDIETKSDNPAKPAQRPKKKRNKRRK